MFGTSALAIRKGRAQSSVGRALTYIWESGLLAFFAKLTRIHGPFCIILNILLMHDVGLSSLGVVAVIVVVVVVVVAIVVVVGVVVVNLIAVLAVEEKEEVVVVVVTKAAAAVKVIVIAAMVLIANCFKWCLKGF